MTKKILTLSAVAMSFASALFAESIAEFGQSGRISASVSAGFRADDNIYLSENNEDSDMILTLFPIVDITYGSGIGEFQLILSEQFLRYVDNDDANNELADLSFSHEFSGQKTKVSTSAAYREFSQGSEGVTSSSQTLDRDLISFAGNVEYSMTAKTSAGVGFSHQKSSYADPQYSDSREYTVPVKFYYAIRPKLDLTAGYRLRKAKSSLGANSERFTDQFISVGVRGVLTAKTTLTADVGLNLRKKDTTLFAASRSDSRLGLNLRANHSLTPKIELDFGMGQDFAIALDGDSQERTTFSARANANLSTRFQSSFEVSYEIADWATGRSDDFWVVENAYVYRMTKNIQLQFGYTGRFNQSDDPNDLLNPTKASFDSNVLFANVAYQF